MEDDFVWLEDYEVEQKQHILEVEGELIMQEVPRETSCCWVGMPSVDSKNWFQITWAIINVMGLSINMLELLAAIAFAIVVANPTDHHMIIYIESVPLSQQLLYQRSSSPGATTPLRKPH